MSIHIDNKLYTKVSHIAKLLSVSFKLVDIMQDARSNNSEVLSSRLPVWCRIKTNVYSATGGRNVVII